MDRDRFIVNWEVYVRCQVKANETYAEAKREFNDINKDAIMNTQSPHKCWYTFKPSVFGLSLS